MENSKIIYSIKLGFVVALSGSLIMLFLLGLDLVGPESVKNDRLMIGGTLLFISLYLLLLFGIFLNISKLKKISNTLSFKHAFVTGFLVSLSTAIFSVLFTLIFYEIIYPDYNSEMTIVLTEKLTNQNLTDTEILQEINEQTKYYSTKMQAQFSFVGNLVTGSAFSFLISLFLKSKKDK